MAAGARDASLPAEPAQPESILDSLSRHRTALLFAFAMSVAVLFLLVNRQAYQGYFADDDLDNMVNGTSPLLDFVRALMRPQVTGGGGLRAAAYLYYYALVRLAGLHFWPYIAGIHAIHLLNVFLIWRLARALGAETLGASAAALFYAFHASAFNIYWSAMYIFDLMCATFVILALLAYVRSHVLLALLCFWLSLKSKEVAILFPLVLAAYEVTLGQRRWKRVIPFLVVSGVVGTFGFLNNTARDNVYTFRFTPAALWTCVEYYAGKLALFPLAGLAVLIVPFLARSRRVCFGLLTFLLLLAPLLFLPGRLFAAYLYVPMIGLALALSAGKRPVWLAVFFLVWMPWNYRPFRLEARETLAADQQRRVWLQGIADQVRAFPNIDAVVYDNKPPALEHWGLTGIVRLVHPMPEQRIVPLGGPGSVQSLASPNLLTLNWDGPPPRLFARHRAPDISYIRFGPDAPLWQLQEGFLGGDGPRRWMRADAHARLLRPAGARHFQVEMQAVFRDTQQSQIDLAMNGRQFASVTLHQDGFVTFQVPVPPGPEESVEISFHVTPGIPDGNEPPLGHPVASFGFLP